MIWEFDWKSHHRISVVCTFKVIVEMTELLIRRTMNISQFNQQIFERVMKWENRLIIGQWIYKWKVNKRKSNIWKELSRHSYLLGLETNSEFSHRQTPRLCHLKNEHNRRTEFSKWSDKETMKRKNENIRPWEAEMSVYICGPISDQSIIQILNFHNSFI